MLLVVLLMCLKSVSVSHYAPRYWWRSPGFRDAPSTMAIERMDAGYESIGAHRESLFTGLDYWTHPKWCKNAFYSLFHCRSKANHVYSAYFFATFAVEPTLPESVEVKGHVHI